MFETLSERLNGVLNKLTQRGALKEADVDAAMGEVRVALLEADVALPVVKGFVEKPEVPPSNLAIVGAYLFRDSAALWRALDRVVTENIRTRGEYQLTDALQMMVAEGIPFATVPVTDWYDCGKKDTWLQTNRILLAAGGQQEESDILIPPNNVAPDARITASTIGPNVSVGPGTVIQNCEIRDCVIGAGSRLDHCRLERSLVGDQCTLTGVTG